MDPINCISGITFNDQPMIVDPTRRYEDVHDFSHVNNEENFWHAQKVKHNINEKYAAKNKQKTLKIRLGSTCSVTNYDNEMKF